MKRWIAMLLCVVTALSLAGCRRIEGAYVEQGAYVEEEKDVLQNPYVENVREALDGLDVTARPLSVFDEGLDASGNTAPMADSSAWYELARQASEREVNPIAGFLALAGEEALAVTSESLPGYEAALTGTVSYPGLYDFASSWYQIAPKRYAYTEAGAEQLIDEVFALSLADENWLAEVFRDETSVELDEGKERIFPIYTDGDCFYTYLMLYGKQSSYLINFYLRSQDGESISDVEIQFLNCAYYAGGAAGSGLHADILSNEYAACVLSFLNCTEKLLCGSGYMETVSDGHLTEKVMTLPGSYAVGEFDATVTTARYTKETDEPYPECAELVTYRIKR